MLILPVSILAAQILQYLVELVLLIQQFDLVLRPELLQLVSEFDVLFLLELADFNLR